MPGSVFTAVYQSTPTMGRLGYLVGVVVLVGVVLLIVGLTHENGITTQEFVRLIKEVPLGTSREDVVAFLDKHKAFFADHDIMVVNLQARLPDRYVQVVLVRHEHWGWNPSIVAQYVFKQNRLTNYQFRELHN